MVVSTGMSRRQRLRDPLHIRVIGPHSGQNGLQAGSVDDADRFAGQIRPGLGLEAVAVVDQHRLDRVITGRVEQWA